jgi:hypothetical protein
VAGSISLAGGGEMSKPPWTPREVTKLNEYQNSGYMHPFTCPNRGDGHGQFNGDLGALVATVRGWICPYCDYTQDWAHDFMFKGAPPNPFEVLREDRLD